MDQNDHSAHQTTHQSRVSMADVDSDAQDAFSQFVIVTNTPEITAILKQSQYGSTNYLVYIRQQQLASLAVSKLSSQIGQITKQNKKTNS